jgi:hypothetical protein
MEWSDENIFKLITLYQQRACLYNIRDKDYHNRIKKRLAMAEIAKEMCTSGNCGMQ